MHGASRRASRSLGLALGILLISSVPARGHDPAATLEATAPEVPPATTGSPASLLEADRDLAAAASKDGLRSVLVARAIGYAIVLAPEPVGLHPWLREHEPPFDHRTWVTEEVEVSSSGMLGYTLSRWSAIAAAPAGAAATDEPAVFGRQIVVWRFHPMTGWKVLLYAAIEQPDALGAPDSVQARTLPPLHGAHVGTHDEAHTESVGIQEFDRALNDVVAREGWHAALAAHLTEDALWLREGTATVRGREAVVATLSASPCGCQCTTVGARAADSTDLGYTYGKCVADSAATGGAAQPGTSWVRVLRRDAEGVRRIAVVLELPIPLAPEK